jgi:hypothetical protein
MEAPQLSGKAMFVTLQAPSVLSLAQLTESVAVVSIEADELRQWFPFVDTEASIRVSELPRCPAELPPLPVDHSPSEDRSAVGREADAALPWLEFEADFPGDDEEVLLEVFSV